MDITKSLACSKPPVARWVWLIFAFLHKAEYNALFWEGTDTMSMDDYNRQVLSSSKLSLGKHDMNHIESEGGIKHRSPWNGLIGPILIVYFLLRGDWLKCVSQAEPIRILPWALTHELWKISQKDCKPLQLSFIL